MGVLRVVYMVMVCECVSICVCIFIGEGVIKDETKKGRWQSYPLEYANELGLYFICVLALGDEAHQHFQVEYGQ